MNALELADEWDEYCGETLEWNGKSSKVLSTMLRTIPALESDNQKLVADCVSLHSENERLKVVLIKAQELLEQGEEVDFDDMMHIEILLEDACEVRELIEKTLNGKI